MNTNTIIQGDSLKVLAKMPKESVDLIYLDPPFFSNKNYDMPFKDKKSVTMFQDSVQAFTEKKKEEYRQEIESDDPSAINKFLKREGFVGLGTVLNVSKIKLSEEERKTNDFWQDRHGEGLLEYLRYMRDRLWHCHRVLKKTGSIYLHCDWHASHYLKVIMDEIFDYSNFRNEIVWCYTGPSNTKEYFPRKHDVILFYTKSDKWNFNNKDVRVNYKSLNATIGQKGIFQKDYDRKKYEKEGKIPEDWWTEFSPVGRIKKELLGYPTQKPEALLERIIKASSNEGDVVLDPFCGCGTSIAVAVRLKRKVIGVDISPAACKVMKERLRVKENINLPIIKDELEEEDIKNMSWFEFQGWACDKLNCAPGGKGADKGIDGEGEIKEKEKIIPLVIQCKHWKGSVGAPEVRRMFGVLANKDTPYGIIIANTFSKEAIDEATVYATKNNVCIWLMTSKELLDPSFDVNDKIKKKVIAPEYAPWRKKNIELTEFGSDDTTK